MSDFQQNYLDFYHSLYDYYSLLRERLLSRGEAYGGLAYRQAAEHIEQLAAQCDYDMIYFVGFNALSECERRIIGEYSRLGTGCLITDGDTYYYDDPMQEAGFFLRKHSAQFPDMKPAGQSHFGAGRKTIKIVECPEAVLQCKYAGQLLAEHPQWLADRQSTAIVLADESLLTPTLAALPDTGNNYGVNISMGYAYADSAVHLMATRLLALYRQTRNGTYYHTSVVDLLSDHIIETLLHQHGLRQKLASALERDNRIRCSAADVTSMLGTDRLQFIFAPQDPTPNEVIAVMRRIAELMAEEGTTDNNKKEKQALGGLAEIVAYLQQLQAEYNYIDTLVAVEKIYQRIARRHNIAFLGQPLSGLQILGMLETRNLDFRRVILLSAGEGVLPAVTVWRLKQNGGHDALHRLSLFTPAHILNSAKDGQRHHGRLTVVRDMKKKIPFGGK